MENKLEVEKNFKDKLIFFFKENKFKFIILVFFLISFVIVLIFLDFNKKKQNEIISEKYIQAGLHLANNQNEKSRKIFEEIILSKNKFYSILSLNSILEKNLENNYSKILEYFEIIESINISRDQKDLIKFKKALFFCKKFKKIARRKNIK